MKNRFIGDSRIPSFKDGSSTIDLSNYSETVMPEYRGFKFLYITVMDISQYIIKSDFYKELAQWGIRYDDGNDDATQEMQDYYVRLDWDVEQVVGGELCVRCWTPWIGELEKKHTRKSV